MTKDEAFKLALELQPYVHGLGKAILLDLKAALAQPSDSVEQEPVAWVKHQNPVHHTDDYATEHLKDVVQYERGVAAALSAWVQKAQQGNVNVPCPVIYTTPPAPPEQPTEKEKISRGMVAEIVAMRALAQSEQEPVVFYRCNGCGHEYQQMYPTSCDCMKGSSFEQVNYYTSPPQRPWVGLAVEEITKKVKAELTHYWNGEYIDTTGARDQLTAFTRDLAATLKEENT